MIDAIGIVIAVAVTLGVAAIANRIVLAVVIL
jgi:hypothetical protein